MIITSRLAWVHLPKTAGTTTDKLFLATGLPLDWHDSQSSPVKHLPPQNHPLFESLPLANKHFVANFRRLPCWLLSNYQHKLHRMGLSLQSKEMYNGLFWRDRDHQWLPADWWLDRFDIDQSWSLLRVEYLKSDFLACLARYEPIGLCSRTKVRFVGSRNRTNYNRSLNYWFTPDDLTKIYAANPLWSSLEKKLYGSLLIS